MYTTTVWLRCLNNDIIRCLPFYNMRIVHRTYIEEQQQYAGVHLLCTAVHTLLYTPIMQYGHRKLELMVHSCKMGRIVH